MVIARATDLPDASSANKRFAGENFTSAGAAMPVPPSDTTMLPAPVGTRNCPVAAPVDCGEKEILMRQLAPAASEVGQPLAALKGPVICSGPKVNADDRLLV